MSRVVWEVGRPAMECPLTPTISSPRRMPPLAAGDPAKTLATRRPDRTAATSIPTPEKRPVLSAWKRR